MENIIEADAAASGSEEVQDATDLAITTQLQRMDVVPRQDTDVPVREAAGARENTSDELLRAIEDSLRAIDERVTTMEEQLAEELTTRETNILEATHSAASEEFQRYADTIEELESRLVKMEITHQNALEGFNERMDACSLQQQGHSVIETNPTPSTSSTPPSDLSQTPAAPTTSITTDTPPSTVQHRETLSNQLRIAINQRKVEDVRSLLDNGADVNSRAVQNRTPLFWATYEGDVDIVRLLLERGANVNAHEDDEGRTPLFDAAYRGRESLVSLLLENEANVNARDVSGWTPLFCAAFYGHLGVVKLLLEGGADVKASDSEGLTPVLYADYQGHSSVVSLLLEGANVNTKENREDNSC